MKFFQRTAPVLATVAALLALPDHATAQRGDSHTWKVGIQAGSMAFQTRTQDTEMLPSIGAHFLIMSRKGGLLFGVDEGIGSDERSGLVLFNDLRRYQATLMAFPVSAPIEPYFGAGFGIMQAVSPRIDPIVTDPFEREDLMELADEASTYAFGSFLAGIQGRWGRVTAFGQYQITSAPNRSKMIRGQVHSIHGGIRIGLGSTRDEIRPRN